jgi:cupin 2 domain-containing protein
MNENLFKLPGKPGDSELHTTLAEGDGFMIERIVSWGNVTPDGSWYDQDHDEWAVVVQGYGVLEDESGVRTELGPGDSHFLPAHVRHRVAATSHEPPCIWLSVHGRIAPPES